MNVRQAAAKVTFLKNAYHKHQEKRNFASSYQFESRKKDQKIACIVLAGYKPFTWEVVFDRLHRFIPTNVDVCLLSSGKYDNDLAAIAKAHDWSYLSTKKNNVSIIQNLAVRLFDHADLFFKIDEDIFVTKGMFESLLTTYRQVATDQHYQPGFVAPILPINGYSYVDALVAAEVTDAYQKQFGPLLRAAGPTHVIENEPAVAKFFWGEGGTFPHIDELAAKVGAAAPAYSAMTIRFSIGCILFSRQLWQDMHMFPAGHGSAMGIDEEHIDAQCILLSQAMILDKNALAGHLSFGKQNQPMKAYYLAHPDRFAIHSL